MRLLVLAGLLLLPLALPLLSFASEEKLLNRSIEVLYELSKSVDRKILASFFEKAWGIAVFPEVKRVGLFVGIAEGKGVFFARGRDRTTFFGPAFYTIQGVQLGIQVGVQSQDVVLFFMREPKGDTIVLGGNLAVALGPTGRGFSATVDPDLSAPCYAYAISRGIFVGISLEGTKLKEDPEANRSFWGKDVPAKTILSGFLPPDFASQNLARLLANLAQEGEKE